MKTRKNIVTVVFALLTMAISLLPGLKAYAMPMTAHDLYTVKNMFVHPEKDPDTGKKVLVSTSRELLRYFREYLPACDPTELYTIMPEALYSDQKNIYLLSMDFPLWQQKRNWSRNG